MTSSAPLAFDCTNRLTALLVIGSIRLLDLGVPGLRCLEAGISMTKRTTKIASASQIKCTPGCRTTESRTARENTAATKRTRSAKGTTRSSMNNTMAINSITRLTFGLTGAAPVTLRK